jgi:hypothetical protein
MWFPDGRMLPPLVAGGGRPVAGLGVLLIALRLGVWKNSPVWGGPLGLLLPRWRSDAVGLAASRPFASWSSAQ